MLANFHYYYKIISIRSQLFNEMFCIFLSVPSTPTAINWSLIGSGKVELIWSSPVQSNGIIQSYTILYSSDKESPDSEWIQLVQNGKLLSSYLLK